ncbi:MAG: ExeM/NucH family extracellular endonuclease [Pseudomonadota bacterium]
MSAELFQNFGDGTNKRTDPAQREVFANEDGRVILDLGDRAKTINVDSNTDHIFILNKLIDLGKPAFKNATEEEQIEAGFGIHTAATQDASRGSNAKKIDIFDNDDGSSLSSDLKKLIEIAQLGGAPGGETDINLRLGNFGGEGETAFFEILVDGKWSTDVIRLSGDVATLAIAELDLEPPVNELSDGDENGSVSENDGETTLTNALANTNDPEPGDPVVSEVAGSASNVGLQVAGSAGGLFTIAADGTASFDDNGEFETLAVGQSAETSIEYTVADDDGGLVTSIYTVTVNGENDAPTVAGPLSVEIAEGTAPVTLDLLLGAVDTDNGETETLTIADLTGLVAGVSSDGTSVTLDPSDEVFESLSAGESEIIALQYNVVDTQGASVAQTATLTVTGEGSAGQNDFTLISDIQGSGAMSDLVDTLVTIEGIVVGDFQQAGGGTDGDLSGFFVQEEDSDDDANPMTSEGLFVFDGPFIHGTSVDVQKGDLVRVTGTVREQFGETQLSNLTSVEVISSGNALPRAATIEFPVASTAVNSDRELIADLEAYEGMLVTIPETMTVSDLFTLGRFGEIGLQAGGLLEAYTQSNLPSVNGFAAYREQAVKNSIVLDDGFSSQNPNMLPFGFSSANPISAGDAVTNLTGVIRYSRASDGLGDEIYRLNTIENPVFENTQPRPSVPDVGGSIKVASFNLQNFFTTLDDGSNSSGPGMTSPRGADNQVEFVRQIDKLASALAQIDADVVGLVEIENEYFDFNGDGSHAIDELVKALNSISGETYDYAFPSNENFGGSDAIMVGLIYNTNTVEIDKRTTVELLDDRDLSGLGIDPGHGVFDGFGTSRSPLAATFTELATGEDFTVAVTHLVSRSSASPSGNNADVGDGAANNNEARTQAVQALDAWLDTDPTGSGSIGDILIVGDLNAYAMETPIQFLKAEGYTDLVEEFLAEGEFAFSIGFPLDLANSPSVQSFGALDYALATASLAGKVTGAAIWQINSTEAVVLDYNTEFKSPSQIEDLYDSSPFRSSDHDAVIVGLDLSSEPSVTVAPIDDFNFI